MQPLSLRSAERVKVIATEVVRELIPASWPHRMVLDVTAAMYGYDHWSHLLASLKPGETLFVFDQDMSCDAFSQRRVDVALHVESRCSIPFPYAYELITIGAVTRDFRREPTQVFVPEHEAYHRTMMELDWWWVSQTQWDHPLVTKGFVVGEAVSLADRSRAVLDSSAGAAPNDRRRITVLLFEDAVADPLFKNTSRKLYVNRGDVLEIEPIPLPDMLAPDYRPDRTDIESLIDRYGRFDWPKRIASAQVDYAELATVARIPRREIVAVDIKARDILRKPWYWPLKCRPGQRALIDANERLERAKWQ